MSPIFIGKQIKERRKFLGIDQLAFCTIAEISQHTLSGIENGTGNPSLSTLDKVLGVLGMELTIQVKRAD
jgi:transcriptional regulator with XRE-family HTH domain